MMNTSIYFNFLMKVNKLLCILYSTKLIFIRMVKYVLIFIVSFIYVCPTKFPLVFTMAV